MLGLSMSIVTELIHALFHVSVLFAEEVLLKNTCAIHGSYSPIALRINFPNSLNTFHPIIMVIASQGQLITLMLGT